MFALYVIALICWLAGSHSAPLSCENLLRPKDQLDLEGRWVLVSASVRDPTYLEKLKQRDSAMVTFGNVSGTSEMSFRRVFSSGDICEYMESNITLKGSGFAFPQFNVTVTILHMSCPDCALMQFSDNSDKPVRLYLFSKRRQLEPAEMEEFKAQAKCLNMTEPVVKDPTKKLCPAEETTEG